MVNVDTFISLQFDEVVGGLLVGATDLSFNIPRLVMFAELTLVDFCYPGRAIDTTIVLNLCHGLSRIACILIFLPDGPGSFILHHLTFFFFLGLKRFSLAPRFFLLSLLPRTTPAHNTSEIIIIKLDGMI